MPDKVPLVRTGTLQDGKIYLRAEKNLREGEMFNIKHEHLLFIVRALTDTVKNDFAWFGIVRAWQAE